MITLGQYLRSVRERKNLSLADVEKMTSVTTTRLCRIEHDSVAEPSPLALRSLAEFYSLNTADLFSRAGYLPSEPKNTNVHIFSDTEKLTEEDKQHIQQQIDYLIKNRGSVQEAQNEIQTG